MRCTGQDYRGRFVGTIVVDMRNGARVSDGSGLPPVGPAWFGAVMGTSILCTLTQVHDGLPGRHRIATGLSAAALLLLAALFAGTLSRWRRVPGAAAATVRTTADAAQWGMVAMGALAAGGAVSTVGADGRATWAAAGWWSPDVLLWVVGTAIGLCTALLVPRRMRRESVTPTLVHGLAVVPPMVSATTGLALVARLHGAPAVVMLVVVAGCFALALVSGAVIFTAAVRRALTVQPLGTQSAVSSWLPLGIVGQSAAAAVLFAAQVDRLAGGADGATPVREAAHWYAETVLVAGCVAVAWAGCTTLRGLRRGMRFTPGWWALTFPVGTLSLGAHQVAASGGPRGFAIGSAAAYGMLVCTWTLCVVLSLRSVLRVACTATEEARSRSEVVADVRGSAAEQGVPDAVVGGGAADQAGAAQVGVRGGTGEPERQPASLEMQ